MSQCMREKCFTKKTKETFAKQPDAVISQAPRIITQFGKFRLRHEISRTYLRPTSADFITFNQSAHGVAMRGRLPLNSAIRGFWQLRRPCAGVNGRRAIQISATPTTESPILSGDVLSTSIDASTDSAGT